MALSKALSPDQPLQPPVNLVRKCRKWLTTMENQKVIAREMIETARNMCSRAEEMRRPPRLILP